MDKVAQALTELGAFLRVGGLDDETARALPVVLDGEALSRMEISTWRTEAGDVDVLAVMRDEQGRRHDYADLVTRSHRTTLAGVEIELASLDDIIASKRFADRDKDRSALPELVALRAVLRGESGD